MGPLVFAGEERHAIKYKLGLDSCFCVLAAADEFLQSSNSVQLINAYYGITDGWAQNGELARDRVSQNPFKDRSADERLDDHCQIA